MKKDHHRLLRALTEQGFTTRRTTKGHIAIQREGRTVAVLSGTPSDWRSVRNARAQLRRAGFVPCGWQKPTS